MTPMTDDEMIVELRREAEYLRTCAGHRRRPAMAGVHDQIADRLHALSADAALGALVRRIREHPMVQRAGSTALLLTAHGTDGRDYWQPHLDGLSAALAHLDSLVPVEPKVVTGPSGKAYRVRDGVVEHLAIYPVNRDPSHYSPPSAWERLEIVTLSDAPVVAKLLGGARV
jgi:hypothetical protein